MEEFFLPLFRKCKYHQLLVAVLGRDICGKARVDDTIANPGCVHEDSDYADHLQMIFEKEVQRTHFGEQAGIQTVYSPSWSQGS